MPTQSTIATIINIMMSGYERKTREYDGNIEQELSRLVNYEKDHIVYSALRQKELSSFNAREIEAKEYLSLIHQKENALQDRFVYLNDLLKEEKEENEETVIMLQMEYNEEKRN